MTGWPAARAVTTSALTYSNWALRSGWLEPSSALRLACREHPISVSNLRTLLGLIAWPISTRVIASLSKLFDTHDSGRTGSPNVAGSTMRFRSRSSVASRAMSCRGPPPSRRTWPWTYPGARGGASRAFRPRSIVLRARPVTTETAARPPHPAARTSLAANNRRPRSSRLEPSASQRRRIARVSIIPRADSAARHPRESVNPEPLRAWPRPENRFTCRCGRPKLPYSGKQAPECATGYFIPRSLVRRSSCRLLPRFSKPRQSRHRVQGCGIGTIILPRVRDRAG